jgi:hypothetical protein
VLLCAKLKLMRSLFTVVPVALSLLASSVASAQYPVAQPGYNQPQGGGYTSPPRQPPPGYRDVNQHTDAPCCNFSIRMNPLPIVLDKAIQIELEYAPPVIDFLSIEFAPSYRYGVPGSSVDGIKANGYGLGGKLGLWFSGVAMDGYYLKAVVEYEHLSAKTDFDSVSINQMTYGAIIGSQVVFNGNGRGGGFTLGGGIGIGYRPNAGREYLLETSEGNKFSPVSCSGDPRSSNNSVVCVPVSNFRLLGQLSLGYTW